MLCRVTFHGAFSCIKMSYHPAQVYLSLCFVRWDTAFRVGKMTTSGILFLQLKSPSLSWSSLPSWSPTGIPAVGNVGWRRQRLQRKVCIKNPRECSGSENPCTEGHTITEECKNNAKNSYLDVQVAEHAHTLFDIHTRTHFFKHKCMLTHSCVLWLCLSACLCWIY